MTLNSALRRFRPRIFGRMRAWAFKHHTELRLAARVTVAAVASFALVHYIEMPQGYWAVFTAVLIMQTSLGGSLQAVTDRMIGTLGGASLGTIAATLAPHGNLIAMGVALAASVGPLALLAALNPSFRVAPITAIIVLMGTASIHEGPLEAGFYRMLAVALGSVVGLVVSLGILPARAHTLMCQAGQTMLELLAELFAALLEGLTQTADFAHIGRLHDDIRRALTKLETVANEAQRERRTYLSDEADPEPLPRALRRLRHDLVMIGRAAAEPLPQEARARLAPVLARVSDTGAEFLRASGAALMRRQPPPDFTGVDEALADYAVEIAAMRAQAGKELPGETAERITALGFALDQLRRDCKDLACRIGEFTPVKKPA